MFSLHFSTGGQVSFVATPLPLGFLPFPISIAVLLPSRWEPPAGSAPLLPTPPPSQPGGWFGNPASFLYFFIQ